jgi:hypothetical protein
VLNSKEEPVTPSVSYLRQKGVFCMATTTHTHTLALRSGLDPAKALTLTLVGDHLHLELIGMEDTLEQIGRAEDRTSEAKEELKSQWHVMSLKAVEKLAGAVHVSDVSVSLTEQTFYLRLWERLGGLRLFPVWTEFEQIDNREAAAAFVREVEKRRLSVRPQQALPGPLDYWVTWAGLGVALIAVIRRMRR